MLRQEQKRDEPAKKSAEPRESIAAEQFGLPRGRVLESVIEFCPYQARESRDANNEKPFIMMAGLAAVLQVAALDELPAAAVEIRLQEVRGGQQAGGNHQAKRRNCERTKVEKWNHRWLSNLPSKVYTRARSNPEFRVRLKGGFS